MLFGFEICTTNRVLNNRFKGWSNLKELTINSLASRYEVLPKEIKAKIPYAYFIKYPQRVELAVQTTKNVIIGKIEIAIKMRRGERIVLWKFTKE